MGAKFWLSIWPSTEIANLNALGWLRILNETESEIDSWFVNFWLLRDLVFPKVLSYSAHDDDIAGIENDAEFRFVVRLLAKIEAATRPETH